MGRCRVRWHGGASGDLRRRHVLGQPDLRADRRDRLADDVHPGTNGWGKASMIGMRVGGAFAAEVILTFLFVLVVLTVTSRIGNSNMAGMAIGLALTIVHLIGIPITGTSVNPARSFGPAVIVGGTAIRQLWLFIVAPLIGGAIAAGVHLFLVPAESDQALLIPDAATASVGTGTAPPRAPVRLNRSGQVGELR